MLSDFYNILATDNLDDGTEFVVAFEAKNYPFSAVLFHPEKHQARSTGGQARAFTSGTINNERTDSINYQFSHALRTAAE